MRRPNKTHYLVSDSGADPVMTDVLGIKREQIEGVRNPGADLIERIEVDEHHVKRLAQAYLDRQSSPQQQEEEGNAAEEAEEARYKHEA